MVQEEQDPTRKAGMSARLQTYVSRAEEIKQLATPVPPPQAAPPPPPTSFDTVARTAAGCGLVGGAAAVLVGGAILTVASLGAGAGVHAAQRGDELGQAGRYSGAAALQEANRRHNLTGKTANAAQAGWEQAKVLDGQYDLRGKAVSAGNATASAAQAGWEHAKVLDGQYALRGKAVSAGNATASAAQAGWERAKVMDGQYDLRGKASRMASATMNAAQAGWHMLSSKETASRSVHEQTK